MRGFGAARAFEPIEKRRIVLTINLVEKNAAEFQLAKSARLKKPGTFVFQRERFLFGSRQHRWKLMEIAEKNEAHSAEKRSGLRTVTAQHGLNRRERIGAHHGNLIDHQRVKTLVNVAMTRRF